MDPIKKGHQPSNIIFCTAAYLHQLCAILAQPRPVGTACVLKAYVEVFAKFAADATRKHKVDTPKLWTHKAFDNLSPLSQKLHRELPEVKILIKFYLGKLIFCVCVCYLFL